MDFETEKICLNQLVKLKKDNFCVEENIIIPDIKPDILSAIDSSGNSYIYKKEISNGKLKIDGGINTYIMYLADDEKNSVRGLHSVIDFSQSIDLEIEEVDVEVECELKIKNIECKILNGRKINIKINFDIDIKIIKNKEQECVKSLSENSKIQMISDCITINSSKGKGETVATAKDTISIDDNLADILNCEIAVKNKELKFSYNKVLSKADVAIEILYITEEEKINNISAQIPIMGFIEMPNITENEICDIRYETKNIVIKSNNVEDHSISVEIEFVITCNSYESKTIDLIQDLYSPEEELIINQEQIALAQNKTNIKDSSEIHEKITIPDMESDKIYNVRAYPCIVKESILNNSISYEGDIILKILYESNVTNRLELKEQKLTFTHIVNSDQISKNSNIETILDINSKNVITTQNNTIDINIGLDFYVGVSLINTVNIVDNIQVDKEKNTCNSNSLTIYFVKSGDTLWKIAKKFKSTVDDIAKLNCIENVDKLNIGEKLYIPKYVSSR